MTKEQLKEYLDSKKMDVVDASVDLGLDIAVALISQDIGINFSNSNAQQCIALAYKGNSEATNELVRSSGITMEMAKTIGFYAKIAKNISDFSSLGSSLIELTNYVDKYIKGDEEEVSGYILGSVFSTLSTVTGILGGIIGTIVSTQLSIASDLANEAASISAQYQERYEKLNSIANGKDYDTVSDEVKAFRNEYDAMKEEATKSKEGYMLFKTFVNSYSSLLVALGCDLSELYSYINEADKYYYGSGEDSINYCENKIEETNYNLAIKFANKSIVDKDKMNNAEAAVKYDPLIIDLDRDGVFTKSKENGVYFDFDGDGFKEKTAWVDDGDGLLVLDRNGNGVIDNGSELFGDKTVLENENYAANGFAALAELDSNGDGVIDSDDDRFSELKVWIDKNSDGISQSEELYSLDELGIKSISLKKSVSNKTEDGSVVANKGVVSFDNGDNTEIGEIKFDIDSMDTINEMVGSIRSEIEDGMPQIIASGNVLSLQEAMEIDDELYGMVKKFTASNDLGLLKGMVEEIIFRWTGVEEVEAGSRGSYVDAKELAVIEKFYGKAFVGNNGSNPNNTAGPILSKVYDRLFNSIYYGLLSQMVLKEYCDLIRVEEYIVSGERKINYSDVMTVFESEMSQDYMGTIIKMNMFFGLLADNSNTSDIFNKDYLYSTYESSRYFKEIKSACEGTVIFNLNDAGTLNGSNGLDIIIGTDRNETINGNAGDDIIFAGAGNDTINGSSGADEMYGEDGDDEIYGGYGDDILIGGRGNDNLRGGEGNDTYVVGLGDGNDTIYDDNGSNIIRFTDGIRPEDLIASHGDNYSIILTNRNTGDSIKIEKFRQGTTYRNFVMVFDDGTEMKFDDERSPLRNLEGTSGNDTLSSFYSGIKYHTGAGDDTINGSAGSDEMYGEDGDDKIYGNAGDDILIGGRGNDDLRGGEGNDTYVVGLGDGNDIIYDDNGSNIIRFTDGIRPEDLIASHGDNYSIILTNRNTGDSIKIEKFRQGTTYRNFIMVFDDGTEMKFDDERSPLRNLEGTSGNDTLSSFYSGIKYHAGAGDDTINGSAGSDEMYGEDGDDTLNGNAGDDILIGGRGNDNLYGGAGNDTYVVGLGDGNDIIYDDNGSNIIRFTDGIRPEDLIASHGDNYSVILTNRNTGDSIKIERFRQGTTYRNFILNFDDGRTATIDYTNKKLIYDELSEMPEDIEEMFSETSVIAADTMENNDISLSSANEQTAYATLSSNEQTTDYISISDMQAMDEISSAGAIALREIVSSDSIITEDFTITNESLVSESNTGAIGLGLSDMDRFTDLQAALLAQELSAWGGDSNIYDTGNNITNIQTDLFTEQFVV